MEETPWTAEPRPDAHRVADLVTNAGVSPLVAWLLVQRGVYSPEAAHRFLHPEADHLIDPSAMQDMDVAADRLYQALQRGERIMVYGDYDVDGTTSVALVAGYLRGIGADIHPYVPKRLDEGYGVSLEGVALAATRGCTLMITLDCGTKEFESLAFARDKGIDVIVCDHHLPEDELPPVLALLNPKRPDCSYPFQELSGCGVAFKLLQALAHRMDFPQEHILEELDLVAISIGADLVDLVDENRVLAHLGLKRLKELARPGLRAMLRAADIRQAPETIRDISFTLGPRINAAGRMGDAQLAVNLLLETCENGAAECARLLEELNRTRREVDEETTRRAVGLVDSDTQNTYCNLVWGKDWHRGVVGIVASRLVEHRYRPSIVLAQEGAMLIGSARSVAGVDIHEALGACSDLLIQYGGHPMAAGLQLHLDHLEAFRERLEAAIQHQLEGRQPKPPVTYHTEVPLAELTPETYRQIDRLEPFGTGNPLPIFLSRRVRCAKPPRAVGTDGKHLKLFVTDDSMSGSIEAVGFNLGHRLGELKEWKTFDIVYTLVRNTWLEMRSGPNAIKLNLHLHDVRNAQDGE